MENDVKEFLSELLKQLKSIDYINPEMCLTSICTWIRLQHLCMNIFTIQSVPLMIKY